jgi:Rieske Fe-S protein
MDNGFYRLRSGRRLFLAYCTSLAVSACASRSHDVQREPIELGPLSNFSDDQTYLKLFRVVVYKDSKGFRALKTVCTHQSCALRVQPQGFTCPCHGSRFSQTGEVLTGPARKPLSWHKLSVSKSGQLVYWPAESVDSSWYLSAPKGKAPGSV